jgi:hypothetical protein
MFGPQAQPRVRIRSFASGALAPAADHDVAMLAARSFGVFTPPLVGGNLSNSAGDFPLLWKKKACLAIG